MHIDEIGSYGLNYVRSKAWFLIKKCGFPRESFDDLQQEMLLDLVQRLLRFNPGRSPRNAFITMVVRNKVASILREREMPSRQHVRNETSLNSPLKRDGRHAELGDTLCKLGPSEERPDMALDLERVLSVLPDNLRRLWDYMLQGLTLTEISRKTGIPRPTLHDRRGKLRRHFEQAGLDAYFEES